MPLLRLVMPLPAQRVMPPPRPAKPLPLPVTPLLLLVTPLRTLLAKPFPKVALRCRPPAKK